MRKGALVSGLLCGVIAVALTGCSAKQGAADASTNRPITILWIGDTTGPLKVYGDVQLAGVKGAAAYFNRHGGVAGRRVEVHAVSDNGDPATAAAVLTKQLASGTPTMVWAGSVSTDSAAMIPILARHRVFAITLVDGQAQCQNGAAAKCPNEWSLANTTSVAQQGVVNWIAAKHFTKVGLLEETTPYSASETPPFRAAAAKAGLSVTTASFPSTALDLTPELQALKQSGAQVIYAEGLGAAKYAFTARANLEWNVPVIFDSSASSLDLTKLTSAANIKNTYEDTLYEEDSRLRDTGLQTMVAWAGRYAKVTALPLTPTSTGWDAVIALSAAVKTAGGSTNVDKLDAAMLRLPPADPLQTLSHRLGWSKNDHENAHGAPADYSVFPVGPLVNGRIQAR